MAGRLQNSLEYDNRQVRANTTEAIAAGQLPPGPGKHQRRSGRGDYSILPGKDEVQWCLLPGSNRMLNQRRTSRAIVIDPANPLGLQSQMARLI